MRVLVVEDYEPIRDAVVQSLRESGYAVDAFTNGEEGLWAAKTNDYDCIVLDWMLPKLSGLDMLQQLRDGMCIAPILMLTAKNTTDDRIEGLDAGADDYLVKPFSLKELSARIRALIRRKYMTKRPVLVIDDLEVDTVRKKVRRAGKEIELSAREFNLLEYLANREGQAVSRTDIWNHVYDMDDNTTSNVVDVYIGYLRKKLEADGGARILHTRRGLGYSLGVISE